MKNNLLKLSGVFVQNKIAIIAANECAMLPIIQTFITKRINDSIHVIELFFPFFKAIAKHQRKILLDREATGGTIANALLKCFSRHRKTISYSVLEITNMLGFRNFEILGRHKEIKVFPKHRIIDFKPCALVLSSKVYGLGISLNIMTDNRHNDTLSS